MPSGEAQVVLGCQLGAEIVSWCAAFAAEHECWYDGYGPHHQPMKPRRWLEQESGVHERRLRAIVSGDPYTKFVGLGQAERLLMAMDREYLLGGSIHVIPNPNWSIDRWIAYMESRGCI